MPESLELPVLGFGVAGRSRAVTAQRRQNIFIDIKPEKDKNELVAYGTPGLRFFSSIGSTPCRGIWWFQPYNFLYAVSYDTLYEVHPDGTIYQRGTLSSTEGSVAFADNGSQIILVDGENGYIFQKTTGSLSYSKAGTVVTVTEVLHSRKTGQSIEILGDANVADGTYTVTVPSTTATALVAGTTYVITSVQNSDFTLVGATLNQVGIVFTATGPTTGIGTCNSSDTWTITGAGTSNVSGSLEVLNNFRSIKDTYTGANFPGANTVVFIDSYFVINRPETKQFWLSGQYDGFYWDPLMYASKEAYTDNLSAVAVDNGNLVLLGEVSQEYWQNTGNFPFPFQRIAGSPIDTGLAARFSVARCAGKLFYLAKSRRGGISVIAIENYQPLVVSTPDLDYLLNKYINVGDAIAFSYRQNGHDFYQINFMAQNVSWLYDATSNAWSVLQSGSTTRHYANRGTQLSNELIVTDFRNGNLYVLDAGTYTDDGDYIARELITPHFFAETSFNKLHIYRLRLDMEQGLPGETVPTTSQFIDYETDNNISTQADDPLITESSDNIVDEYSATVVSNINPQVMLQVSRDGGYTYGNEMWTSFGRQGEYLHRAEWRRLGVSRNFVFKFRITDPVKCVLISSAAYATMAAK